MTNLEPRQTRVDARWQPHAPRDGDPGVEMRFHDEWWHIVFSTARGHEVVLGPIGIDLGTYETMDEALARAEANARERAMNTLDEARASIRRATMVLGSLSRVPDA